MLYKTMCVAIHRLSVRLQRIRDGLTVADSPLSRGSANCSNSGTFLAKALQDRSTVRLDPCVHISIPLTELFLLRRTQLRDRRDGCDQADRARDHP